MMGILARAATSTIDRSISFEWIAPQGFDGELTTMQRVPLSINEANAPTSGSQPRSARSGYRRTSAPSDRANVS